MPTTNMPNRDHNTTALDDHLSVTAILRYLAALLAGLLKDNPEWERERRHLQECRLCADAAAEHLGHLLWDSPDWDLLEPGEFARRAQDVWITRLQHDDRAPMREAAALQLGTLEPLSNHGFRVLLDAAVADRDPEVRFAAAQALRSALDSEDLLSRVQLAAGS